MIKTNQIPLKIADINIKNWKRMGAIIAFSTILASTNVVNATQIDDKTYLHTYNNLNFDEFDDNFCNIYEQSAIIIDNVEYETNSLYLKTMPDAIVHLFKAGDNDIDILTGERFLEESNNNIRFRDASLFYKMYEDGLISSSTIDISKEELQNIILNWDGKTHTETPDLRTLSIINGERNDNVERNMRR